MGSLDFYTKPATRKAVFFDDRQKKKKPREKVRVHEKELIEIKANF